MISPLPFSSLNYIGGKNCLPVRETRRKLSSVYKPWASHTIASHAEPTVGGFQVCIIFLAQSAFLCHGSWAGHSLSLLAWPAAGASQYTRAFPLFQNKAKCMLKVFSVFQGFQAYLQSIWFTGEASYLCFRSRARHSWAQHAQHDAAADYPQKRNKWKWHRKLHPKMWHMLEWYNLHTDEKLTQTTRDMYFQPS